MNQILVIVMTLAFAPVQSISADTIPALPEIITKSFKRKYPQPKDVRWEIVGSNYRASFHKNNFYMEAIFDSKGSWLETITLMDERGLPEVIKNYILVRLDYGDFFEYVKRSEKRDKVTYIVGLKNELEILNLTFDRQGNLLATRKKQVQ